MPRHPRLVRCTLVHSTRTIHYLEISTLTTVGPEAGSKCRWIVYSVYKRKRKVCIYTTSLYQNYPLLSLDCMTYTYFSPKVLFTFADLIIKDLCSRIKFLTSL